MERIYELAELTEEKIYTLVQYFYINYDSVFFIYKEEKEDFSVMNSFKFVQWPQTRYYELSRSG